MVEAPAPPFVPRLLELLAIDGPLTVVQLAEALAAAPEELQRELQARGDVVETGQGWRSLLPLVEGVVLTHVVVQEELDAGVLVADGDLGLWTRLGDDAPLPGEHGPVQVVRRDVPFGAAEGLRGPAGWLAGAADGDLVGVRMSGGRLVVEVVREAPEDAPGMPELIGLLLRAVQEADDDPGVFPDDVVVELLLHDAAALRVPSVPLLLLAETLGLEVSGGRVALPGTDWSGDGSGLDREQRVRLAQVRAGLGVLAATPEATSLAETVLSLLAQDGEIVGVVGDELAVDGERRPALPALAEAASTRQERAAVACLQALVADADGDVQQAQSLLDAALNADPSLQPAAELAAHYAADRGDAAAAERLYRQAGHGVELPWRAAVRDVLAAEVPGQGRNRPCPCGSGRKAKLCCGTVTAAPLPRRAQWRWVRAVAFAMRPAGGDRLRELVRAVPDEPLLGVEVGMFEGGLLARYLQERSVLWPADERDLVASWLGTPPALYEVVGVAPGRSVTLRALPDGAPLPLRDRELAAHVERLDLLAGRLLPDGAGGQQFVTGPWPVARPRRAQLLAALAQAGDDPLALAAAFAPPGPPQLVTQEGEPVVLCRARFAVPDLDAAWAALRATYEDDGNGELLATADVGGTTLVRGVLRRTAEGVDIEANAVERVERLSTHLLEVAPGARLLEQERTSYEEAMAHADVAFDPARTPPPEVLEQISREAEERWLGEPVPALGGRTPREAAADPAGRAEVAALLDDFAWQERESPVPVLLSSARLREQLGLPAG